jgi:hypothetical protein
MATGRSITIKINQETYQHLLRDMKKDCKDVLGPDPFQLRVKMFSPHHKKAVKDFHTMLTSDAEWTGQFRQRKEAKEIPNVVPNRVNLIWLGGQLPKEYYDNVLSWKKHNDRHDVVVYMDENPSEELRAWAIKNGIALVDIHQVICEHELYPYFLFERSRKNYGTSSDIARVIIEEKFGGGYFDLPDVRCRKALPELKANFMYRITGNSPNNDAMFVLQGNNPIVAVTKIIKNRYEKGYDILSKEDKISYDGDHFADATTRKIIRANNLTGIRPLETACADNFFTTEDKSPIDEAVEFCKTAGTWLKEKEETKVEDKIQKLKEAIDDIFTSLHFQPKVLDLDKYAILQDAEMAKIAVCFIAQNYRHTFDKIENVVCYKMKSSQEFVEQIIFAGMFPKIANPMQFFQCVLCTASNDQDIQDQIRFFHEIIKMPDIQKGLKFEVTKERLLQQASISHAPLFLAFIKMKIYPHPLNKKFYSEIPEQFSAALTQGDFVRAEIIFKMAKELDSIKEIKAILDDMFKRCNQFGQQQKPLHPKFKDFHEKIILLYSPVSEQTFLGEPRSVEKNPAQAPGVRRRSHDGT